MGEVRDIRDKWFAGWVRCLACRHPWVVAAPYKLDLLTHLDCSQCGSARTIVAIPTIKEK